MRLGPWLGRLWPRRLAGQTILLLLLALVLAQGLSFVILMDERWVAIRAAERDQILARTASIVRLLERTPPDLHDRILESASSRRLRFWLTDTSEVDPAPRENGDNRLQRHLVALLDDTAAGTVLVELRDDDGPAWRRSWWRDRRLSRRQQRPGSDEDGEDDDGDDAGHHRHPPALSLVVAVALNDGRWLNAANRVPDPSPRWGLPSLVSMMVMAVSVCLIVALMVRRLTRPMARLAGAAERLGRGETVEPLPEQGPVDIRQATRAFNRMHQRLQRFVEDRTRMLAAISHDLRTPITTLRLRAEFIEDDEIRQKILETLDEMQRMTEATLSFAREEAAREDTRTIDLAALVDSVVADLADLGQAVEFDGPERVPYPCRPVALKRALRNLIENAVAYGERARVRFEVDREGCRIIIDDDGRGIPEDELERVFQPFVRLEESRNAETGGIGLGMAIARSIVRGHGGDIVLENRSEGGLRATIRLPAASRA